MTSAFSTKEQTERRAIRKAALEVAHRARTIGELQARQYSDEGQRRVRATIANLEAEIVRFGQELAHLVIEKYNLTLDSRD